MSRRRIAISVVGLAVSASVSLAQTNGTYLITFDGVVTPQHPTMTVGIWATWDDPQHEYALGNGNYDLEAGEGEFVSGKLMFGVDPPNSFGILAGRKVIGAHIGQIYIPGHPSGILDNPIRLATYEWTTTDFTPRTITFETSNTDQFILRLIASNATTQLYPHEFTPGRAEYVIPSPFSLTLIGFGCCAVLNRQRLRGR